MLPSEGPGAVYETQGSMMQHEMLLFISMPLLPPIRNLTCCHNTQRSRHLHRRASAAPLDSACVAIVSVRQRVSA